MKKAKSKLHFNSCFLFLFIFIFYSLPAQVTFVVDSLPDYTPPEDILYIAGDFQGWNPGDPMFALQKNGDDKWFIELEAMPDETTINFKFTRGDWGKVEKGVNGEEIPDRQFTFGNGETVSIIIFNWADYGGGGSTAADNVSIMDEEFYLPQLDRSRRIWIYLPPGYDESNDHYPVIYMHDGQNLFDSFTSYAGEWEVDETLNDLSNQGYFVPIVVGIDNGGSERINEYTPWSNSQYGGGDGSLYIDFIVETLKPYIDQNYRTLPERESTAIWGSSLGGLISQYGALKFQNVFSKAGVYSPSYWFSDSVWTFTNEMAYQQEMKLYQMTGSLEGGTMVPDTWSMHDTLTYLGFGEAELYTTIVDEGEHNEQLWREEFESAYLWLFYSFANSIADQRAIKEIILFPNPADAILTLPFQLENSALIKIYDTKGMPVYETSKENTNTVDISLLKPGVYLMKIIANKEVYSGKFIKK